MKSLDLAGRTGILEVGNRKVETPALMPVVNPNLLAAGKSITPSELEGVFSFDMIITNSYILRKSEDLREEALSEGLHSLMDYQGMIMTDSGTFQSYIYNPGEKGEVDVDFLEIVRFQRDAGSDIGTILDKFTVPEAEHRKAEVDLRETLSRARSSFDETGEMELAVPVQGGLHPDLREMSGRLVREMGATYAPIGGVVPLMESYRFAELVDVIVASKRGLGPSIPVHLFGAGHPMIIPLAVALGCDLFDSASYAKFGMDDRYMTPTRTRHLNEIENFPCSCPVCSSRDPSDLMVMDKTDRTMYLSRHNLWVLRSVFNEVKDSIKEGTLWELVERSALNNPSMYSAVKNLNNHRKYLEENAPRSGRRFSCVTDLSLSRPEFGRYDNALDHHYGVPEGRRPIILNDWTRSHSPVISQQMNKAATLGYWPIVRSPMGPIPYDIIDCYPLSQSIFPERRYLPPGLEERYQRSYEWICERTDVNPIIMDDGPELQDQGQGTDPDAIKVSNIARLQFGTHRGIPADMILFGEWKDTADLSSRLDLVKSRRTGRIRNVRIIEEGEVKHLLSLRAEDGLFTLKLEGAKKLHSSTGGVWNRVIVDEETGEYNARGFNVFSKFVMNCDEKIRAGDEVMVVDEKGNLLAVGKASVPYRAMMEMKSGVAVKVREGVRSS